MMSHELGTTAGGGDGARSLAKGIVDGAAQTFKKLERRNSNVRLEGIHVARDEETDAIHNARSTEADVSVRLVCLCPRSRAGERYEGPVTLLAGPNRSS